jgi:uncharacterized protein
MLKRVLFVFIGNIIIGVGIGLTVYCDLGIDPSTTFFSGINNIINIGLGNCISLGNALLFIPMFMIERKTIHLGTFVNMLGVGYVIQYSSLFFINTLPVLSLPLRFGIMFIAIIIVCIGCGLYLSGNLGQAPWDSLAHLVNKKFPKIKYSTGRMIQDISALILGFFLGAQLGVGSIIFAFCLGPGIQFFRHLFERTFFKGVIFE